VEVDTSLLIGIVQAMLCAFAMRAMKTMHLMTSGSISTRMTFIMLAGVLSMPNHLFLQHVSRFSSSFLNTLLVHCHEGQPVYKKPFCKAQIPLRRLSSKLHHGESYGHIS